MNSVGVEVNRDVLDRLCIVRESLLELFVEKEEAIDAIIVGLLSGEPVLLVGPPGTAKTQMIEALGRLIDARYFYYLLTRFTEPDEILGPLDINALREGVYRRITANRLPEAEIVFLDEIFKASSAIRNVLLDIVLYKRVLNGTEYINIPMLAFYSASNEVSADSEDAGFYDRLTIRSFGRNVSLDRWSELLQRGLKLLELDSIPPIMNAGEVKKLQRKVYERTTGLSEKKQVINKFIEVLMELRQRGINLSDRRKIKTLHVASAFSVMHLEEHVTLDSLADAIRVTAPSTEDDMERVEEAIIRAGLSSYSYRIRQLQTLIAELRNVCRIAATEGGSSVEQATQAITAIVNKAKTLLRASGENPRLKPYARQLEREIARATRILEELAQEHHGSPYTSTFWRHKDEE